jgi:hypothetical protein
MGLEILVGHLVGDFLLQDDWLASGKKRSDGICGLHVLIYTLSVLLFTGWFWQPDNWILFWAVAIPHYLIDRTRLVNGYMYLAGQSAFATAPMAPWSIIAVDNSMHLVCLLFTAWWQQTRL